MVRQEMTGVEAEVSPSYQSAHGVPAQECTVGAETRIVVVDVKDETSCDCLGKTQAGKSNKAIPASDNHVRSKSPRPGAQTKGGMRISHRDRLRQKTIGRCLGPPHSSVIQQRKFHVMASFGPMKRQLVNATKALAESVFIGVASLGEEQYFQGESA